MTVDLKTARVLCIGDVLLEHSVHGTLRLGAGETEPALIIEHEMRRVGGAAVMFAELAALGAAATLVSVAGNDDAGREIERLMAEGSGGEIHLLVQPNRVTARRSRFLAGDRQLLRADHDSATPLGPYVREDLLRLARELVTTCGAVVISDHGKGVLTEGVALEIIKSAREAGAKAIVAAEGGDPIRYRSADLLTATRRELAQATGMPAGSKAAATVAARALIDRCALGGLLVSEPGAGTMLVEPDGGACVETRGGAGIAVIAAGLAIGLSTAAAMRLAAARLE
ncbi:MAG TPA: hypothetical protein VHW66_09090 [Stellaceae bacterium]|nr:hypothetical protein [Stellaceae bacterium]